jgi:hypothetical protein
VPILMALFDVCEYEGADPADRNRDERYAETAQSGAMRPSNLTVLNSSDVAVGPRS